MYFFIPFILSNTNYLIIKYKLPLSNPYSFHQIIANKKSFDFSYQGDPDYQPVRPLENATFVRFLTNLSRDLSHVYSTNLSEAIKLKGVRGFVARTLFLPPPPTNQQVPLMRADVSDGRSDEWWLQPRFRMRCLASYSTWGLVFLLVLLLKLVIGCDVATSFLLLVVLIAVCTMLVFKFILRVAQSQGEHDGSNGRKED